MKLHSQSSLATFTFLLLRSFCLFCSLSVSLFHRISPYRHCLALLLLFLVVQFFPFCATKCLCVYIYIIGIGTEKRTEYLEFLSNVTFPACMSKWGKEKKQWRKRKKEITSDSFWWAQEYEFVCIREISHLFVHRIAGNLQYTFTLYIYAVSVFMPGFLLPLLLCCSQYVCECVCYVFYLFVFIWASE